MMSDAYSWIRSLFIPNNENVAGDEEQIELSRVPGTIWNAVLRADLTEVQRICREDPSVIFQRGGVGDLPIHCCFLYNSEKHLEIARWIMDTYPESTTAQYEGTEYTGENILHIAIINQDFGSVKELVSRSTSLLHARATGTFFQEGSACAYGEHPLAFAACTNQRHIVRFLLNEGADIECEDSSGNNLLHLLVRHNLPEMYTMIKEEYKKRFKQEAGGSGSNTNSPVKPSTTPSPSPTPTPAAAPKVDLWLRRNVEGLTPFGLAAQHDYAEMFSFLLQETKQTQWTYGPVSCDLYPLTELDLHLSTGEHDGAAESHAGALELIMHAGNVNLLMHPRMVDLVSQKWNKFASRIFTQRFRIVVAYLLVFMLTTIVRQSVRHVGEREMAATEDAKMNGADDAAIAAASAHALASSPSWAAFFYRNIFFVWLLEWMVLFGAGWKGYNEAVEMYRSGLSDYFSSSGSALLENVLSTTFCTCIFLLAMCNMIGSNVEAPLLAMASIAGWSYLFFFLLAFRLTGPMVVMIYQMLLNDVLRFCVIYLVFLAGFAQAFFVLFERSGFGGYVESVQTCFVAMLGDFDVEAFSNTPYVAVSVGLLVVYVVVITILLLNLLIAMMGDTYEKINEAAEMQWHLERARIVFAIENEMSSSEREDPANKYWTMVDGTRFLQVLEVDEDFWNKQEAEREKET